MTDENKLKKQYLNQYWVQWLKIDRLQEELEEWQLQIQKLSPSFAKFTDVFAETAPVVLKITDLKAEIQLCITEAIRLRKEIETAIQSVQQPTLRELLMHRYIKRDTWEVVADKMHYAQRHVKRLHNQALNQLHILPSAHSRG